MTTPVFAVTVKDGEEIFETPYRYASWKKSLEGKRWELVLRKRRIQRSNPQNNYYWGVVLELLSEVSGHTPDEMHEICRYMFLRKRDENGLEYVESTASLDTVRFEKYLSQIKQWAAEFFNCPIPDPNEVE